MGKNRQETQDRRNTRRNRNVETFDRTNTTEKFEHEIKPKVVAKNKFQQEFDQALRSSVVTISDAPAGVGKTYVACSYIADLLKSGEIKKVVICRPNVLMGASIGMLKGSLFEKMYPLVYPILNVFAMRYGANWLKLKLEREEIQLLPVEYARGRDISDCALIVDESQLLTPDEMYTMFTRVGDNAKVVFLGDHTQTESDGLSGLEWATSFAQRHKLSEDVKVVTGTSDYIVRSGFCKAVVQGREKDKSI